MNVLASHPSSPTTPSSHDGGAQKDAVLCWVEDLPPERNQFVSFELDVQSDGEPDPTLHLFADTRYRLFINERFIAYGPARFVTSHPEYDTFDLTSHLEPGRNRIRVEVNFYGASSFQTMPDGRPAFYAAGGLGCGRSDFATPGAWKARVHRAWAGDAPAFSFAQNPSEICDTRVLAEELRTPASRHVLALDESSVFRFPPIPRRTGYPDYAPIRPDAVTVSSPLSESSRWGVQFHADPQTKPHHSFATWIYSPGSQRVNIDCFWMDIMVNGRKVDIQESGKLGNHSEGTVFLHEGWNFLSGCFVLLGESWPLLVGFPAAAGLSLHPLPDQEAPEGFVVSAPLSATRLLPVPENPADFQIPEDWRFMPSDINAVTPARLCAWERPLSPCQRITYGKHPTEHFANAAMWTFSFAEEYYGHPLVDVDAPEGSVLDIAYDDWQRGDGCVHLYNASHFTDAADRFILRGGRQRVHVLNPRGGRYLQVILRTPPDSGPALLTVHDICVQRRTQIRREGTYFRSADETLNWAWDTSLNTLECSADEAYTDTPWRERASYIGDVLVSLHLHTLASTDLSIARRTLQIFAQARLPNGQLPCCAPAWLWRPHEDYTLLWPLAVRDYWSITGDLSLAEEEWPVILECVSGSSWSPGPEGLWNAVGTNLFVDWGVLASERTGEANATLNILRVAALRSAAELAEALGRKRESHAFLIEAASVSDAIFKVLWDEAAGRFHASAEGSTPALHANILALRFGIGSASRLMDYLEPLLVDNINRARKGRHSHGYAELYFFFFLLPALADVGRHDLAEGLISSHYGHLKALGLTTLPEELHQIDKGKHSCCHTWSGAPAIYATERVLGLRRPAPGNPNWFLLAPESTRHEWAEGRIPHPLGHIHVRWERQSGKIHAKVSVPPGVVLTAAPNVSLSESSSHRRQSLARAD